MAGLLSFLSENIFCAYCARKYVAVSILTKVVNKHECFGERFGDYWPLCLMFRIVICNTECFGIAYITLNVVV